MNEVYEFRTDTSLPIEAFTVMGMSAKPNSKNPIGEFGTGLKLAVATVLRLGGKFMMAIDGVTYVFYVKDRDFRGSSHQQVMMRRQKGIFSRFTYHELPFTLNYGRNLGAWQVYRELESNTRDEGGVSGWLPTIADETNYDTNMAGYKRTVIRVSCPGLREAIDEGNVFLKPDLRVLWENSYFRVLDAPSDALYYRGIRVFSMKMSSRYTYDFKPGHVRLTEDRSPENPWWMMHLIQHSWMTNKVEKGLIYRALSYKEEDQPTFETHELSYDATTPGITPAFQEVAEKLKRKGFTSAKVSALAGYFFARTQDAKKIELDLTKDEWTRLVKTVKAAGETDLAIKIQRALFQVWDDVGF